MTVARGQLFIQGMIQIHSTGYLYSNITTLLPGPYTEAMCMLDSCDPGTTTQCNTADQGATCCCFDSGFALLALSGTEFYTSVKVTYSSILVGSSDSYYMT